MSEERSNDKQRRPDRAAFAIAALLALAGLGMFFSTNHQASVAGYSPVGPTTVPYIMSGALIVLGVFTAIAAYRGDFPEREPINWPPVIWVILGMVAQMLTMRTVGFSIATGLLFALTARGFGRQNFLITIPVGIIFSFFVWYVFAKGLQLSLPSSPFEAYVSAPLDWLFSSIGALFSSGAAQ